MPSITKKQDELSILEEEEKVLQGRIFSLRKEIYNLPDDCLSFYTGEGGDLDIIRKQNRLKYTHSGKYTD